MVTSRRLRTSSEKPWNGPTEVLASEMHEGIIFNPVEDSFFQDVKLRLTKTKDRFALCYEFADPEEADQFRKYVSRRMRETYGAGCLRTRLKEHNGTARLYFRRGKDYKIVAE